MPCALRVRPSTAGVLACLLSVVLLSLSLTVPIAAGPARALAADAPFSQLSAVPAAGFLETIGLKKQNF
jgi:hypothetical protein